MARVPAPPVLSVTGLARRYGELQALRELDLEIGPGALLLIATTLVPLVSTAVLAAALASRRGGRSDQDLLTRLLGTDPSNPASGALAVLMLAPWLILTPVAIGAPLTILGHAVPRTMVSPGPVSPPR